MALPIKYNVKNVFVRWRSTLATILGVGLVVAVYMLIQALAVGLLPKLSDLARGR